MKYLDGELLKEIERALDIKFYEWQRNYLLGIPMILDMRMTGRCTGKTLAYIIKKLYEKDEPLYLTNIRETLSESDWWCMARSLEDAKRHGRYDGFFRGELRNIYEELNRKGLTTRKVIFDECTGKKYSRISVDDGSWNYKGNITF